jgi:hypothetical protein
MRERGPVNTINQLRSVHSTELEREREWFERERESDLRERERFERERTD